ncbi:hypothetical protein V2O64_07735 [Verrucomicrobiaceae bacterium 227]
MDQDLTKLEAELARLKPMALPNDFLSRLEGVMEEAADEVALPREEVIVATSDPALAELEEGLRMLSPHGMPDDLISRLDQAMQRWHEDVPVEEKVIPMHPVEETGGGWFGIRSVAAVGILGAAMAFMWTGGKPAEDLAGVQRIPVLTNGAVAPAAFVSRDASASVVSANDHGVVWTKDGQALRCLEVQVNNSLEFVNANGERITLEKPNREVRFVPAKFD